MLPQDPMILYSYLNTKLRDEYPSLEALCEDLDLDPDALQKTLAPMGFAYDPARNRFA
ncbi:MAG: DUF4250 domain-containing protein [Oscillospiraceae bacterium]|nr:DUF4250 domain-containing protein [Oscillospiraceae bacterium]